MTPIRTATRTVLPLIKVGDARLVSRSRLTAGPSTSSWLQNALTPISAATGTARAPIRLPGAPTAIAFR